MLIVYSRIFLYISGCLLFLLSGFMCLTAIITNDATSGTTAFLFFSIAVMSFSIGYLFPQFKQKDERMKVIREKGIYLSFFAFFLYNIILMLMMMNGILALSAVQILSIEPALIIITAPLSWIVLSKVN